MSESARVAPRDHPTVVTAEDCQADQAGLQADLAALAVLTVHRDGQVACVEVVVGCALAVTVDVLRQDHHLMVARHPAVDLRQRPTFFAEMVL